METPENPDFISEQIYNITGYKVNELRPHGNISFVDLQIVNFVHHQNINLFNLLEYFRIKLFIKYIQKLYKNKILNNYR